MKKVEKSASKNKNPIKLRFLIWRLQGANPEKKVIPENQGFGSCPFEISKSKFPKNVEKICFKIFSDDSYLYPISAGVFLSSSSPFKVLTRQPKIT